MSRRKGSAIFLVSFFFLFEGVPFPLCFFSFLLGERLDAGVRFFPLKKNLHDRGAIG